MIRYKEYKYHPWTQGPGWVTRQYKSKSHETAEREASVLCQKGWSIWLVSNVGEPGFVVYRKGNDHEI
jgi:hypothetical protein